MLTIGGIIDPRPEQRVDFQHNSLSPCRGEKGVDTEEPEEVKFIEHLEELCVWD